jgi:hypothetical protein
MERVIKPMYRRVLWRTVVYRHSSLYNMPAHKPLPYLPILASYHADVEATQKEPSRSLMVALPCRNI